MSLANPFPSHITCWVLPYLFLALSPTAWYCLRLLFTYVSTRVLKKTQMWQRLASFSSNSFPFLPRLIFAPHSPGFLAVRFSHMSQLQPIKREWKWVCHFGLTHKKLPLCNSLYSLLTFFQLESDDHSNLERQILRIVEPQHGFTLGKKVFPNKECLFWTITWV